VYPAANRRDGWGAYFRRTYLWAKGLEATECACDIHLALSPIGGRVAPDVLSLTVAEVKLRKVFDNHGFD